MASQLTYGKSTPGVKLGPKPRMMQLAGALQAPTQAGPPVDPAEIRRKAFADALRENSAPIVGGGGAFDDWAQILGRFGQAYGDARTGRDEGRKKAEEEARARQAQDEERSYLLQSRDWQRETQGRTRQDWKLEDERRQKQRALVQGLQDPKQRALAEIDPDVAFEAEAKTAFGRPEQFTEGGYMWTRNPDGTLVRGEEIPMTKAERAALAAQLSGRGESTDARLFSQGQALADDFRMQVKDYQAIADTGAMAAAYARQVQAGTRDPAMEGALLMKIAGGLQSGILTDSDIRVASGGTLPTNILSMVDMATGRGRLSEPQMRGLLRVAQVQDQRARERVEGYKQNVLGIARARGIPENYIFGVDPMATMFPQAADAPVDDTPMLLKRLEELERAKRSAPAARPGVSGFRDTMPGQPGGYTGR